MKHLIFALFLCLALPLSALADPSKAVQTVGEAAAAAHLITHEGAFTDGLPEKVNMYNRDGEHICCTGSRVAMWDTPQKGDNVGTLYPGSRVGYLNKTDEFELVRVRSYRGKYYAQVRIYDGDAITLSGWVNANYISCSCTDYSETEEIPEHETISLSYHLR